jgi:Putative rhamnosyl transferase
MAEQTKTPQVIGLVRFSVLATDYYSDTHGSPEAVAAHLYTPERMALRLQMFETLCLPSLVRQSDQGFRLVVLTSTKLPADVRAKLDALIAPHENMSVFASEPGAHYQIIKAAYASAYEDGHTHRITFRLDDDDALAGDYIARLKALAGPLLQMKSDEPTVIAFNRGFYVEVTGKGNNAVFDTVERAPLSCGTALLHPVSYGRNPYRYNHRALAQHYTVYSDISAPCFLRTIHRDNKSSPAKLGIIDKVKPEKVAKQIKSLFGFDIDMLKGLR